MIHAHKITVFLHQTEFQGLLDATVQSNVGTWSTSDTNYSAAKVLTSKKNNNVKIVLPAQELLVPEEMEHHIHGGGLIKEEAG